MTPEQLDRIPDNLLTVRNGGALDLIDWLRARGWQMSLAELADERARRGIRARGRR